MVEASTIHGDRDVLEAFEQSEAWQQWVEAGREWHRATLSWSTQTWRLVMLPLAMFRQGQRGH